MTETELARRLEKLERDNRRLKGLATIALIIAAALGAIYAARPVPQRIEAHEFDVVDNAGKVRVRIGQTDSPEMYGVKLYYRAHHTAATLEAGTGAVNYNSTTLKPVLGENAFLSVQAPKTGLTQGMIGTGPDGPAIVLFDREYKGKVDIGISTAGSPHMELADGQGFTMNLGSTDTVTPKTGATQKTSAASITMFGSDKEHRVIWQAP
jgi:hypothetical protein